MAESHSSSACLESAVEPAPSCMLATPIGLPDGWMITRVDSPEMEHSHFQVVDKPMLLQESHTYCELYLQQQRSQCSQCDPWTPNYTAWRTRHFQCSRVTLRSCLSNINCFCSAATEAGRGSHVDSSDGIIRHRPTPQQEKAAESSIWLVDEDVVTDHDLWMIHS